MALKLSDVISNVVEVLNDSAISPDYLAPEARVCYDVIKNGGNWSQAAQATVAAGAVDDRERVQKLFDLENVLTTSRSHPGGLKAYEEMHRFYGLDGVQALYDAGYNTPEKLWDFWQKCNEYVPEMAHRLGLDK